MVGASVCVRVHACARACMCFVLNVCAYCLCMLGINFEPLCQLNSLLISDFINISVDVKKFLKI